MGENGAKNLLLGILVVAALSLTIQPLIVSIRTSIFTNHTVNAQLLNDRDSDGIEDDSYPCPMTQIQHGTTPETEAQLPGINAPIDQSQGTGGTSQSTPGTPSGAQTQSAEINFCIPNKEACNQTDVLINEAGDLICDPKESDCSAYLNQQPPPEQEQDTNVCIPENQSAGGAGGEEGEQVTNICTAVPVAQTPHSMWKHYPVPDEEGLQQAKEQQQEQDQRDEFACDFAEHASEAVGAFYTCAKVGEEFKDALNDPGKVVSPKEVAFCGFGISGSMKRRYPFWIQLDGEQGS